MNFDDRSFCVAGGDLRFAFLAEQLGSDGFDAGVCLFNEPVFISPMVKRFRDLSAIGQSDIIILPVPYSTDGQNISAAFSKQKFAIKDFAGLVRPGSLVFAGKADSLLKSYAEQYGFTVIDYLDREEMAVLNAVPTAEGAIAIAINETEFSIFGSNCLVTGYGRIAKVLTNLLVHMGANVTVAARKSGDRCWAQIAGAKAIPTDRIIDDAAGYDLIFNTVPSVLLDSAALCRLKTGCLVIDLASKPGGVDLEAAKEHCVKTIWALSLPGKVAPKTAGQIILNTILGILKEY